MDYKLNKLKGHLVLSFIATFATNLYFATWFMISPGPFRKPIAEDLSFNGFFLLVNLSLLGVSLIAIIYPNIGAVMSRKGYGPGGLLTAKTTISVVSFALLMALGLFIKFRYFKGYSSINSYYHLWEILSMGKFRALLFFFTVISVLMFFISNLEQRTGNITRLWKQSMGEILNPKVLFKGFLFIDLNHATTIAEELGSVRYANMLRDCFALLGELVAVTPLEVYQFVGDEAVITWDPKKGNETLVALQLFFDFRAYIAENTGQFVRKYGVNPKFKAAYHGGEVVKSEIGKGRKHLVFHGDVLNTTSRLLGMCHGHGTDCIASQNVLDLLGSRKSRFMATALGELALKGKGEQVIAYGIHEVNTPKKEHSGNTGPTNRTSRLHMNIFTKTKPIFQL